jgi:TonB-dependent Receptor Plug Domain
MEAAMTRVRMLALFIVAGTIGCASGGGTPSGPRANREVITQQEIAQAGPGNAYDVIRRLRPNFLVSRGATTFGNAQVSSQYPNVFVDGMMYGDINSLRNIDAAQVGEVRMYPAGEAQTKFGLGNSSGVIAIATRK